VLNIRKKEAGKFQPLFFVRIGAPTPWENLDLNLPDRKIDTYERRF